MASRRKLERFTEQELEELLHGPATSGLRNVLAFGRGQAGPGVDGSPGDDKPPADASTPGDVKTPAIPPPDPSLRKGQESPCVPSMKHGIDPSSGVATSPGDAPTLDDLTTPEPISSPGAGLMRRTAEQESPDPAAGAARRPAPAKTPPPFSRQRTSPDGRLVYRTAEGVCVDPRRVRRASLVQHGHSPTEHLLYQVLYDLGTAADGPPGAREVQIGYDRLARQSGITKRNIIPIMRRLEQKLALEVIQEEDSARNIARRYRVYGLTEILGRRERAGMLYVIRHKGVDFVFPSYGDVTSPDDVSSADVMHQPV